LSSILGSFDARFAAGLADTTSHRPSSTILGRRLAETGRSPALRCIVWKNGEKYMLQAYVLIILDVS
jgi:hypothetical protein